MRLPLAPLPAAVERWIITQKSRMAALPGRNREKAARTGFIPAEEDTAQLGLLALPAELTDYVEAEGGLFDPADPSGAEAATKQAARRTTRAPLARISSGVEVDGSGTLPAAAPSRKARPPVPVAGLTRRQFGTEASSGLLWIDATLIPSLDLRKTLKQLRRARTQALRSGSQAAAVMSGAAMKFIPASQLVEAAPAVAPGEGRLGAAWAAQGAVGSCANLAELAEAPEGEREGSTQAQRPERADVRYSGDSPCFHLCSALFCLFCSAGSCHAACAQCCQPPHPHPSCPQRWRPCCSSGASWRPLGPCCCSPRCSLWQRWA